MRKFEISADSTCDFYASEIKENEIFVAPLEYVISKGDEMAVELDNYTDQSQYIEFYNRLKNGCVAKTSVLNVQSHIDLFKRVAKTGAKNLLHITQGYGLSPTLDNANKAIEEVKESCPDINIVAMESNTTTCAEGFIVKAAIKLRDEGKTLEEALEVLQNLKKLTQHFIMVNDLKFLARGGRISKASANIGSFLQVKPIIEFNKEGKLQIVRKEIGLKKAMNSIINEYKEFTLNKDFPYIAIVHTGAENLAKEIQSNLKEKYGVEAEIRLMGPVISAHVGPGAVAYTFISNEERKI